MDKERLKAILVLPGTRHRALIYYKDNSATIEEIRSIHSKTSPDETLDDATAERLRQCYDLTGWEPDKTNPLLHVLLLPPEAEGER